ncbi:MAG: recombinase family protein [Actinobacteria bacterium]|nr:recombinase family protein [Actinomycetota bacterium]
MLTFAYCRVSTEEQAAEGFSITGQADKLRAYAELHDLGPVTVIEDPGRSGKDLERPGLQKLLAMVEQGHVSNVLIWKLDRLSRNLGDLVLLAERFAKHGVGLHSFTEKLDLSSATGRMFYNVLGAFAQFYREQLVENVKLGMQQAAREGKWTNRPKTGYSWSNGRLVPNADAPRVREVFRLRAEGLSLAAIEERVGLKLSTVRSIVLSRIYLGEVLLNGEWYPGAHEALVAPEEWERANRTLMTEQRRRSRHPLSGAVRCGLCGRVASVHRSPEGRLYYRCRHRGAGCRQPARAAVCLERAVLLGMRLLAEDAELQEAIRRQLAAGPPSGVRREGRRRSLGTGELRQRRRQLLDLYYGGHITAEGFHDEEERLRRQQEAAEAEERRRDQARTEVEALALRFEEVARVLQELDVARLWAEATEQERRILVEDLVEEVAILPDHLEVQIAGAPRLNVLLSEVGLREKVSNSGVGGST